MRLILFGTGPFAVPSFRSLIESAQHDVLAIVTRPIADAGKRRKSAENPVRDLAVGSGLEVHQPASANDAEFVDQLRALSADLFVVCDFGQILSSECLAASGLGGINLHGSLLPKYRGAAPINWAIYNGDDETGVTVIHMTPKLDGGPMLTTAVIKILPDETTEQIEPRLAELGVRPVHDAIEMLSTWDGESPIGKRQNKSLATKAPRLQKSQGLIDWTQPSQQIINHVRAFQPWPGTFTHWHGGKQPLRLIIHRASVAAGDFPESSKPGEVVVCDQNQLVVRTGDGALSIDELQPAGKKKMPVADFLRGRQPAVGDSFN